jgi:hypothetical protein
MRIRIRNTAITGAQACTLFANGETEDFGVIVVAATPCSGTPNGGTASGSVDSTCANTATNIIFSVTGATAGVVGLTYQWQSSTDKIAWTNMVGKTNDTMRINNLTTTMYYRRTTTCTASTLSANSAIDSVVLKPFYLCMCSPLTGTTLHSATSPSIDLVEIPTTTLSVANVGVPTSGYTFNNNPSTIPDIFVGTAYDINVTTSAAPLQASVWIDTNRNGIFESTEYFLLTIAGTASTVNFTLPVGTSTGLTSMRVRVRNGTYTSADACLSFASGETEDFIINIANATPCSGTPTGGTTSRLTTGTLCPGASISLSVSGATAGVVGLSYQWQSSTDGITFTDIAGATNGGYTGTISTSTYFRRTILCGGASANSTVLLVNVGTASTLPLTEGFESLTTFGAGILPGCWNSLLSGASTVKFTSANTRVRANIGPRTGTKYVWSRWSQTTWLVSEGLT